jgi:lipopolysaccharide exporter
VRPLPCPGGQEASLAELGLSALKWNYLGVIARVISQLGVGIVLARLLGPEAFGMFGAALFVIGLGHILGELGLSAALVQKKNVDTDDVRVAFTWLMLAGVVLASLTVVAAPLIAALFNDSRLTPIVRAMALALVFQGFGWVSQGMLSRALDMKSLEVAQIISYLAGFLIVGIGAALLGAGAWSLVAAFLTQTFIRAVLLYRRVLHPVRPLLRADTSHLHSFGGRVVSTNIANWTIENMDNFLVGKLFGMAPLGLYSVAYNLVRTPTNHMVIALQNVLFPASARIEDDDARLRLAFLATISAIMLAAGPVFAGVGAVSNTVVEALYGSAWLAAAPLLLPLALAMPLHAVMSVVGPILWGQGMVGKEFKVQFCVAVVFVLVLLVLARVSIVAVAWGVFLVYGLRAIAMIGVLAALIGLTWKNIALALRGGLVLAAFVAIVLLALDAALVSHAVPAGLRLALEVFAAFVVLLAAMALLNKWVISADLRRVLDVLVGQLPFSLQTRTRVWLGSLSRADHKETL